MSENSWVGEQLAAFQDGLNSIELVSWSVSFNRDHLLKILNNCSRAYYDRKYQMLAVLLIIF
jgi:hypothetical protein